MARSILLTQAMNKAQGAEKNCLRAEWNEISKVVHSEKLGETAAEFDHIHSVHRALEKRALHRIIPPRDLRPYLIDAIRRGMEKEEANRRPPEKRAIGQDSVAVAAAG